MKLDYSLCVTVSSADPNVSRPLVVYRVVDAAERFVRDLQQEAKQLFDEYIAIQKPMLPLITTELRSFNNATICHICTKPLGDDIVTDHCHIVGRYRGDAHSECNIMYRMSKSGWKLLVVTHQGLGWALDRQSLEE